jgi:hypothetical protein
MFRTGQEWIKVNFKSRNDLLTGVYIKTAFKMYVGGFLCTSLVEPFVDTQVLVCDLRDVLRQQRCSYTH